MSTSKDASIQSLRGLAIVLVVGLHITNDAPLRPAKDLYDFLGYIFQNIRIPLFTVISGYLYGLRPVLSGGYLRFIRGKVRRILLPLLAVSSLEFVATSFLPGVNSPTQLSDVWKVWLYPYGHFWFLQVIFFIFIIVGFLDSWRLLDRFSVWVFVALISIIIYLFYPLAGVGVRFFSVGEISYLAPFFLCGYGIARFPDEIYSHRRKELYGALFLLAITAQAFAWFLGGSEYFDKRTVLGLVVSISACFFLFKVRRPFFGLSFVGAYAYTVFLYQGFGTAIGRRVFGALNNIDPHFYFFGVLITALVFGVIVEKVFSRVRGLRTIMLGLR